MSVAHENAQLETKCCQTAQRNWPMAWRQSCVKLDEAEGIIRMQTSHSASNTQGLHAPSAECSKPIDLVHLARYTLGNRELEHEVLELFSNKTVGNLAPQGY